MTSDPVANALKSRGSVLVNSARPLPLISRLAWIGAFFALWSVASDFGWVSPLLVPPPSAIVGAARNIGSDLLVHALATLARASLGFVVGAMIGAAVGFAVQYSNAARTVLEPVLDASRPVPALALLPFFILLFGFSEVGRFTLIILSVSVFVAIATTEAIAKVPEAWTRFARVAGLTRLQIFRQILLPGATPWLVGPIRLALATAFTLAIASEFMGAQQGLGYLINTARVNLATPTIWLAVIILGFICQVADIAVVSFFRAATRWYQATDQI